jgi:hypothetical protein
VTPAGAASAGQGIGVGVLDTGIAASGGPAGVAPGADSVDLKVAGADGATTLGQVLAAMQLADAARERFNLRVLNVSLGAPADGVTVVAATGNEGGGVDAPGLDPYVLTVGAGLLASLAVVLLDPGGWDRSVWPRLAVLLVLTAASEIAGLRLPHRGALEMLNLYEGMVVVSVALLPAGQAIAVSLGGLLVAQVVQRRAPVKAVFNLGMYATALAPRSACTTWSPPTPAC